MSVCVEKQAKAVENWRRAGPFEIMVVACLAANPEDSASLLPTLPRAAGVIMHHETRACMMKLGL